MARREPSRTSKAEAAANTRAALLDAGAQLLHEQPVGAVLTQVKSAEIARRAGRTIGAFYHHWADQESYQRDLIEHVLSPDRLHSTSAATESVVSDLSNDVPMEEIVRRGARANFEGLRENTFVPLFLALWAKQGNDEHIREQLRGHYHAITGNLVPAYRAFFDAHGLEMRPPFTVDMFAVALTALVEGLTVRAAVDPTAVPMNLPSVQSAAKVQLEGHLDDGDWDLFSILVLALLPSMTVPKIKRDSDLWLDHEDVRGLVRRLRETWEIVVGRENSAPATDAVTTSS